ncbi:hypothetical protein ACOMHN_049688 [Nucella lapillus]
MWPKAVPTARGSQGAMPGMCPVSQESWKQVHFDVMTGRRRRPKSRSRGLKMPTISMLCSCVHGQHDDFPDRAARPFARHHPAARLFLRYEY